MKTRNLLLLLCLASFFASAQVINKKSNPVRVDVKEAVSQKPVITWITPAQATSTHNDRKLKIKAGIKSASPLKDVSLFVNEKPLGAERGMGVGTGNSANFDKVVDREIDLTNGINELKLVAINENDEVTTEYRTINVTLQALASSNRVDYALLIGTNDYDEWDDLTNPVFDVNTIAQELEGHYQMKVEKLINPTTAQIITKLREYGKKSYNPHDQLFIFIAGHGQFDEVFSDGYIVGKNSKLNDEAKESYISHTNLRTIIGSIPSNHIFLTMDVCFGGTFDRAVAKRGADDDGMYADIETNEFVERKLRHKTRLYVTSGGKNYVKDGRAGAHSPFARKFIEALRTYGGRDKVLTTQDIWVYLETLPMEPHRGEFEGNEPGSDFVFVAK
jgi:hypothetical protein